MGVGREEWRGRGRGRGQEPRLAQMLVTNIVCSLSFTLPFPFFPLSQCPHLPSPPRLLPQPPTSHFFLRPELEPSSPRAARLAPPGRWPWRCGTCGPPPLQMPLRAHPDPLRNVKSEVPRRSLPRRAGLFFIFCLLTFSCSRPCPSLPGGLECARGTRTLDPLERTGWKTWAVSVPQTGTRDAGRVVLLQHHGQAWLLTRSLRAQCRPPTPAKDGASMRMSSAGARPSLALASDG